MPSEAKAWIDEAISQEPELPPYREIVNIIYSEQQQDPREPVSYDVLRVQLRSEGYNFSSTDIKLLCQGMAAMAPDKVKYREKSVEIEFKPDEVLAAIESAVRPKAVPRKKTKKG